MYLVNTQGNKDRPNVITQARIHFFFFTRSRSAYAKVRYCARSSSLIHLNSRVALGN